MAVKQTAGRNQLGSFAPKFAELNDDVLFGEVWSREDKLSLKMRSIVTIVTLVAKGLVDSSFEYHMTTAKQNGVTREEMAEILTHEAFYAGWPNAWAAFRVAVKVYVEDEVETSVEAKRAAENASLESSETDFAPMFGMGSLNDAYAQYFVGNSYLKPLTNPAECGLGISNVVFEPSCRNNWHIHHAAQGGGQILLCTDGVGWYQEWGKPAQKLTPGTVVVIPAGVKHWHGADAHNWFAHIAFEAPGVETSNEWLEPVDDEAYSAAITE